MKIDTNSLSHTTWNCKYQGRNEKAIEEYIRNQLKEDKEHEQLTMKELFDLFTGEPVTRDKK